MRLSTGTLAVLAAAAVVAVVAAVVLLSGLGAALAPGVGLRSAAIASFVLTVVILVVFLFAAGDGLLGEIQFVLPAFFVFFVFNWLLIAWVF